MGQDDKREGIIALDVDGTILDYGGYITRGDIIKLKERNRVGIISKRSIENIKAVIDRLNIPIDFFYSAYPDRRGNKAGFLKEVSEGSPKKIPLTYIADRKEDQIECTLAGWNYMHPKDYVSCPLCKLYFGDIKTKLYSWTDKYICVDCINCRTPMFVFRTHEAEPREVEKKEIENAAYTMFGRDITLSPSRSILNHYHFHIKKTERSDAIYTIYKIKGETEMLLNTDEAYQLFMVVERTKKTKGDIAEVGVYKGGTAKLICEAKGDRLLHLFDTFEGIPRVDEIDAPIFHNGEFKSSFEKVKSYLQEYKNVYIYKGVFPATAEPVKGREFSFVHLDVDTYKSTSDCLWFFYPRMTKGGIIMIHDYCGKYTATGVKKAVDEFFGDKPEFVIETLSSSHGVIAKT